MAFVPGGSQSPSLLAIHAARLTTRVITDAGTRNGANELGLESRRTVKHQEGEAVGFQAHLKGILRASAAA